MDSLGRWSAIGGSAAKGLTLATASLALSACAVATPATLTSAKGPPSAVTAVEFVSQDEDRGLRARFKSALGSAFAQKGVSIGKGANYLADFTISERSAELALQDITGDDANATAPASDYEPRWFHKCKPARVSASLVIFAKASGELHSKSEGEFLACPGDTSQLNTLAELLAARALQN